MQRIDWDRWLVAIGLVKLGQELGSESPVARAVHDLISLAFSFALK
jgi:hypothetical protein